MDVTQPHERHRGFVALHTDPSLDDETESAEGITVRIRLPHSKLPRRISASSSDSIGHRSSSRSSAPRATDARSTDPDEDELKTGTGTGIRQRSHLHR
jgi:hypothetical protein